MAQAESTTAELMLTESLRVAIDHAFREGRACLDEDGGLVPFTIICTSDGYDIADHPGASAPDIYASVRTLIAREMPEAYAFVYDGFVETDEGRRDALICEAAKRGDAEAYLLAELYREAEGGIAFDDAYVSVGAARQLYPLGTKPIVSGLMALEEERRAAGGDAVRAEAETVETDDGAAPDAPACSAEAPGAPMN